MRWWQRQARQAPRRGSTARHGRHGRVGRSSIVRPPMPPIDTRYERIDLAVGSAAEYLRGGWPELRDVRFEIAGLPREATADGVPRWRLDRAANRIIIYRIPIERLNHLQGESGVTPTDDMHKRLIVESTVFRAAAEWLGREPWDLAPERFPF